MYSNNTVKNVLPRALIGVLWTWLCAATGASELPGNCQTPLNGSWLQTHPQHLSHMQAPSQASPVDEKAAHGGQVFNFLI